MESEQRQSVVCCAHRYMMKVETLEKTVVSSPVGLNDMLCLEAIKYVKF